MNGLFIADTLNDVATLYGRQEDEGGGNGDDGDADLEELGSSYWVVMEFAGVLISVFFYVSY